VGTVVLLHAAGLDSRMWRPVQSELTGHGYTVECPDLLGHGAKRVAGVGVMEDFAADIVEELREAARPLFLVGLSLGGMVAQLVAGCMPTQIGGLVLCDTMCKPSEAMTAKLRERAGRTRRLGAAGMVDETVVRWFGPDALSSHLPAITEVRSLLADADTEANARTWETIAGFDGRPALNKLRDVRTLVIHGELDVATPAELSKDIVRQLPRSERVVFEGCGHMAPLEDAELFVRRLIDFLEAS
jgi:3-oxoadipate enol-lactonase/4-carboxymuconolactone decarboxylase